jgi:hypothetical protein
MVGSLSGNVVVSVGSVHDFYGYDNVAYEHQNRQIERLTCSCLDGKTAESILARDTGSSSLRYGFCCAEPHGQK